MHYANILSGNWADISLNCYHQANATAASSLGPVDCLTASSHRLLGCLTIKQDSPFHAPYTYCTALHMVTLNANSHFF